MSDTTANSIAPNRLKWLVIGSLAVMSALLLWWMPRGIQLGDGAELGTVARFFGIAHPTGYPLYTGISRVLFLLFQNGQDAVAWLTRLSWIGAIWVLTIPRKGELQTLRHALGLLLVMLIGFEITSNMQTTTAEVYATLLLLILATLRSSTTPGMAMATGFFTGLTISHHWLGLGLIPIWLYTFFVSVKANRKSLIPVLGATALGLTPWLMVGLRASSEIPVSWNALQGWSAAFAHITGKQYLATGGWSWSTVMESGHWFTKIFSTTTIPLVVLSAMYWKANVSAHKGQLIAELGALIVMILLMMGYPIPDREGYLVGASAILLWWSREAILHREGRLWRRNPELAKRVLVIVLPVLAAAVLFMLYVQYSELQKRVALRETYVNTVFNKLPAGTLLLAGSDAIAFPLIAGELSRGEGKGVTVVDPKLRKKELFRQLERIPHSNQVPQDDPRWQLVIGYRGPLAITLDPLSPEHDAEQFRFQLKQIRMNNPKFLEGVDILPRGLVYQIRRPGEATLPVVLRDDSETAFDDALAFTMDWCAAMYQNAGEETAQRFGNELVRANRYDQLAAFGIHLRARRMYKTAEWCYTTAMGHYPAGSQRQIELRKSIANLYRDQANQAISENKQEAAIDWLIQSLSYDPGHATTMKNAGLMLLGAGKFDEGIKMLNEYLQLRDDPQIREVLSGGGKLRVASPPPIRQEQK